MKPLKHAHLLRYLRQDPDNISLLLQVCQSSYALGNPDEARTCMARALASDPDRSQALIEAMYERGDYAAAGALLETLPPGYACEALLILHARVLHQSGNLEAAIARLEPGQASGSPALKGFLALLCQDAGQNARARTLAEETLRLDAQNREARIVCIYCALTEDQAPLALIREMLDEYPGEARLWFALGCAHLQRSEGEEALAAFTEASRISPEWQDNTILQAMSLFFIKNPGENKIIMPQHCEHGE